MTTFLQTPSFIEYPALNASTLAQSARNAGDAVIEVRRLFLATSYLPSLHGRVLEVGNAMHDAAFKLREVAQSTDIGLLINVGTLKGYQEELIGASASDKEEILGDIADQADKILGIVSKGQTVLQRLYTAMKQPIDRVATGQYLAQLAADQQRLPAEILEIKERLDSLEEQRLTLTQAMALIESKSFTQVGKDTLLNGQEISKLAMAVPEVAIVEKALEMAQTLLDKVDSLMNYFGLMDARNTVRKQIADLLAQTHDKTGELRLAGLKSELIAAFHNFDDHRDTYVAEVEKVILAKRSFLSVHRTADWESESSVLEMIADALALAKFLKAVG